MRTLWPKNQKFYTFLHISSTSTPFQKHFTSLHRVILVPHFMFWLLSCTLWLGRIMSHNVKLSSSYTNQIRVIDSSIRRAGTVVLLLLHFERRADNCFRYGSRYVSIFFFLYNFVSFTRRNMCDTSMEKCVLGLHFFFLHLRALTNFWDVMA